LLLAINKKPLPTVSFLHTKNFGRRLKGCRFSFPNFINNTGFILAALVGGRFDKVL